MAKIPVRYKNNININPPKIGVARREEILDGIEEKGTLLPRGISEEDMDESFIDFISNKININIDGIKVPVVFLTIQRWSEFTKTWQFTDKYKNIEIPFITIVRNPDIQVGQNQAGLYNIPGHQTYTYMKIPTWDGSRKGIDLYKIPQPTSVDLTFEVRIFTNRMKDLNKVSTAIHKSFQSRQSYINVKGHPMPVILESISDDSNIDEFEQRRFYVQLFEMTLMGYVLDEADFEVVPTINRTFMVTEIQEDKFLNNKISFEPVVNGNSVNFSFIFKPNADPQFTLTAKYAVRFTQLANIELLSRISISINGITVFDGTVMSSPITINAGDIIIISVSKVGADTGKFQLIGSTI